MKRISWLNLSALLLLSGSFWMLGKPASAALFDQQDVDEERFVVVAAPIGAAPQARSGPSHQLLILEQLSDERPCWQVDQSYPGRIDPLLLDFDFTGICARSNDSNGYSLRIAGEDLGLQYSLRILEQDNRLILAAVSNRNPRSTPIVIGWSQVGGQGFTELQLAPGWRLTRRVYEGQATGHVYVTHDEPLNIVASTGTIPPSPFPSRPSQPVVTPPAVTPPAIVPTPATPIPTAEGTAPIPLPVPPSSSAEVVRELEFSRPTVPLTSAPPPPQSDLPAIAVTPTPLTTPGAPPPPPSNLASALGFSYRVIIQPYSPDLQNQVRAIVPDAFRTTLNGQQVIQAGLFEDLATAEALREQLRRANIPATILPVN